MMGLAQMGKSYYNRQDTGSSLLLETERLVLRPLEDADFDAWRMVLGDPEVMYAYEHGFSDDEVRQWIRRQQERYAQYGFGLWAAVEKASGELIGDCGVTMQAWGQREVPEIGYHLRRDKWRQGFASEAAIACKEYTFTVLGFQEVYSIIRENNLPSQHVALRNGMSVRGSFVKHYRGMDMLHYVFSVKRG